MKDIYLSSLSVPRQRLVRLLKYIGFGRVEHLRIAQSEPCLDPLPRVIRRRKNGGRDDTRPQMGTGDFAIKREWVSFFEDVDAIGNGTILSIEVAHGLPILHEFEDVIDV
jgi:hypothetical protein